MTTAEIDAMLVRKYPPPAWALFFEFPNATGSFRTRACDAVAFNLFPSQGLHVIGIEVKVSRGDWLRELKDPKKADAVGRYCDFWMIAAPKDVVDPKEMPPAWGLMCPRGENLAIVKQPTLLPADKMDKRFLASLMRQIQEKWISKRDHNAEMNDAMRERYNAGYDNGKKEARGETQIPILESKIKYLEMDLQNLKSSIARFENASGIKFDTYDMGRIGEVVKVVRSLGLSHSGALRIVEDVKRRADDLSREAGELTKMLENSFKEEPFPEVKS